MPLPTPGALCRLLKSGARAAHFQDHTFPLLLRFDEQTLRGKVPGADNATFVELANIAKVGCPVSKVLNATITLDAALG